jgi:hypothetical protein
VSVEWQDHPCHFRGDANSQKVLIGLKGFLAVLHDPIPSTWGTHKNITRTLLHVLSASSEFLGNPELRLTVHVPAAYLVPAKADLMLHQLASNEDRGLDTER